MGARWKGEVGNINNTVNNKKKKTKKLVSLLELNFLPDVSDSYCPVKSTHLTTARVIF